jgi:hypothetical protein
MELLVSGLGTGAWSELFHSPDVTNMSGDMWHLDTILLVSEARNAVRGIRNFWYSQKKSHQRFYEFILDFKSCLLFRDGHNSR